MALTSLIFFVAVLATTDGLNCLGKSCSGREYCMIRLHENSGSCTAPHGHIMEHHLCLGPHHSGDQCYCHEQTCVDSMVRQEATPASTNAPTNAQTIASAAPTVGTVTQTRAPPRTEVFTCFGTTCITPKVCRVTFQNSIPISGSCELPQANAISCIPPLSNGDCACASRLCTGIIDTLTTQSTTQGPVTTFGLTSTDGTTPLDLCADLEDAKFNCKDYNDHFGLCTSLASTLQTIARTRCPKFCNLCDSNGLAPTKSALTGSTSLPPCVDHDHRCLQVSYKNLLCNPNALPDTKRYAIQTCPFTCNYCAEYLAGFTPTLTTGPPCEDKMNCTILVASNTCDVPIVKTRCAKSCNICSQGTLLNVQPVG